MYGLKACRFHSTTEGVSLWKAVGAVKTPLLQAAQFGKEICYFFHEVESQFTNETAENNVTPKSRK